jgi:Zn-dependent protease with chaperone function
MAITQAQFDDLVARLEREADRNPGVYKVKLGMFATLGYLYILGVLLALVATTSVVIAAIAAGKGALLIKLVIPLVVLVGIVLKSLWVKLDAPQGVRLTRGEHPRLFDVIDGIRRAASAPPAHEVLLTNELNAAIVQVPRLGLFGWHKNYLILGLPLLAILSPEEFKAVLAHEFGHLSGAHGRFGAWIYRVRAGWARLNAALQQTEHWGRFLFVPFFDWYAPKFAAYSFVQARQQEYEADSLAAETVGADPLASALVRLSLKSEDLDRHYWPTVLKAADRTPTPEGAPFRGLLTAGRGFLPNAGDQLRQALQRRTNTADTHPSLGDRVASLGKRASVPPPFATSAAEELFADRLADLVARFDREWVEGVTDWWRGRHERTKTGREKLAALAAKPRAELDDAALYEYGLLVEEFEDTDKAFEIYKSLVLEKGAKRGAKFAYARLLLTRGDGSGVNLLQEVMHDMPEATLPACDLIVGYLHANGKQKEAQPYIDRYYARQQHEHQTRVTRETLRLTDKYVPQTLSAESLAAVKTLLASHRREIKAAYLVRKQTPQGEPPLHVVAVLRRAPFWRLETNKANQALVDKLATAWRGTDEIMFIWLNGEQKTFIKPMKKVAGSQIV